MGKWKWEQTKRRKKSELGIKKSEEKTWGWRQVIRLLKINEKEETGEQRKRTQNIIIINRKYPDGKTSAHKFFK